MGLPLLIGILIYVIIMLILSIWLKNHHHLHLTDESVQNQKESLDPEKQVKGIFDKK